jgi:glycosidase
MTRGWLKDAVIYQIFIDRFAGYQENTDDMKPEFVGGNLGSIIPKLPYLVDLGINTIWLTPFLKTTDYHGYSTLDLYQVDPHFGTIEDAKGLVAACHKAGIRVLMDFNANHVSNQHPYFVDAQNSSTSSYRNWFYFNPDGSYMMFLDFGTLPKLNLEYRPAREHVIGAAEFWLKELGIDGFRLDHAIGPSDNFWREFNKRVKALNPTAVLIGEATLFGVKRSLLPTLNLPFARWFYYYTKFSPKRLHTPVLKHYVGILDGCLDYTFVRLIQAYAKNNLSLAQIQKRLAGHYRQFPNSFSLPTFLENHDNSRFLHYLHDDYDRLKKALEFQFAIDQPKIIYYGQEVGMSHDESVIINEKHAGDLPSRRKMNWNPNEQERGLLEFYKGLIGRYKMDPGD